jgi:hypothetical protein
MPGSAEHDHGMTTSRSTTLVEHANRCAEGFRLHIAELRPERDRSIEEVFSWPFRGALDAQPNDGAKGSLCDVIGIGFGLRRQSLRQRSAEERFHRQLANRPIIDACDLVFLD